ncbi:MAG TPA: ribokinase [Cyclobacteriaceae bacterium]|nr:ribokinase [Cyclobacteriaceae bacterium]
MSPIYIVGSSNTDMVVKCDWLPGPGETVLGGEFIMTDGGKGANQAVAAARLGGKVRFIANVGDDLFGHNSIAHFQKEKIDTSFISIDPALPSGVALINVDSHGENTVTVASGSNGNLKIEQVDKAFLNVPAETIVLLQLEIPMETVAWTIAHCHSNNLRVILNPAPAQQLSGEIYKNTFLITPNEKEAEVLTGISVSDENSAKAAAIKLINMGVNHIVITLGSKGAYLHSHNQSKLIPAPKVVAVDTTGAGDCFNGALAVGLAENMKLEEAVSFAVKAASVSVARMGAQASMPVRNEINP